MIKPIPIVVSANPARTMSAAAALPRPLSGEQRDREHAERQGRERQPGLHRVVLERHLQEERQRDHRPAQGDLLHHLLADPDPEVREPEQVGVEQGQLAGALAFDEPPGQQRERDRAERHEQQDRLAAFLPHEDAEHDAAHADDGQHGTDRVDVARSGVLDVADELHAGQHHGDDHDFEREADPPRQVGRDEPAEQRPDRGGDRRRGTDQRVRLLARRAFEVAVDERLHRRQQERRAEAADDRPKNDDRGEALGEGHGQRADRVRDEAEDVRPFAADEVADLAADEDERGRDQRLERDRRLHATRGRVEIVRDRRDRHVHQRRVDDEHEHRHRQEQRQHGAAGRRFRNAGARVLGHRIEPYPQAYATIPS